MLNSPELFGTPKRFVMDPVHGAIPYFEHENFVINHPLFQRLRYICQNDIMNLVFPGATHNRFLHSLGAMHLAGRMFQMLFRSYLFNSGKNIILEREHKEAIQYLYACVRLAALLHDAGHAPFSHQFENSSVIKELLSDEKIFKKLWHDDNYNFYFDEIPTHVKHEHYSVRAAVKILKDASITEHGIEIQDVISIMETTKLNPSKKLIKYAKLLYNIMLSDVTLSGLSGESLANSFLYLLKDMISGEVDADKMDYLLRDSYFSGAMHGIYNLDHIMQNLRVAWNEKEFIKGQPKLSIAIESKGVGALEEFVHSRYKLYIMLYNHKTCVGFTWLLEKAVEEVLKKEKNSRYLVGALTDINKFVNFTDTYFWEKFRAYATKFSKSASQMLLERKKLKFLYNVKDINRVKIERVAEDLSKIHGEVIFRVCNAKFSKIMPNFEKMLVLHKNRVTGKYELNRISQHTDFFEKFSDTKLIFFYKKPEINFSEM